MDLFTANLANRSPVIAFTEHGSDVPDANPDANAVGEFIATREAELMTLKKSPAEAGKLALDEAIAQFPQDAVNAWRYK